MSCSKSIVDRVELPLSEPRIAKRPPLLVALVVILFLECGLLIAAAGYLIVELVTQVPDSYASAVAILLLTCLAAVWLGVMAVQALAGRPWIRGGATVWQVLQIAVAVGSFQGMFAQPAIGWVLIVPAVAVLVLLFTPSVIAATRRPDDLGPDADS
jgi:hypothetical protein